ncbi:MAG: 2-oxo acid dehydrogenase subunit E2, partial [Phycisphaerae bacterium]|nr:2-oxo acid dehydrogenase subunit E2 [Phycisphaerae bacterium]
MYEFKLPDLGEGVHEGQIIRMHVVAGQMIREDDPLMEVETDKAAVEIPSPVNGLVTEVHASEQAVVHVGDVMVTFETNAPAPLTSECHDTA